MEIMFLVTAIITGIIVCAIVFSIYLFLRKRRSKDSHEHYSQNNKPLKSSSHSLSNSVQDGNKRSVFVKESRERSSEVKPTQHEHKDKVYLKGESPVTTIRKNDLAGDLERQARLVQAAHEKRAKKEEAYKRMHRQKVADSLREMEGFLSIHKDNLPEKWKEMNVQLSVMERKIQGIKGKQLERKNRDMLIKRIERYKGELVAVGNEIRRQKKQYSFEADTFRISGSRAKADQNNNEHPSQSSYQQTNRISPEIQDGQVDRSKRVQNMNSLEKNNTASRIKKNDVEFERRQKQLEEMVSQLQTRINNKII